MPKRPIVITGFMGAGKTAVARELARALERESIDLDQMIKMQTDLTPQQIIEQKGEAVFREVEKAVLRQVLENRGTAVIALGGGAFSVEQNRKLITQHDATTIWLDATFETCWRRILAAGNERPMARNEEQARFLYDQRRPQYALAQLHIPIAGEEAAADVAAEILSMLNAAL
ncbi:MAG TPA: shikimate kinase [Pyrinomonadaceae bacterium]|nr:shikimate kinase [Pyrinomonadaceae bacterium]